MHFPIQMNSKSVKEKKFLIYQISPPWKILSACEFGDKLDMCSTIKPDLCYDNYYRDQCCAKCKQFELNLPMPNCRYGNKASWCNGIQPTNCYGSGDICCQTCSSYKSNVTGNGAWPAICRIVWYCASMSYIYVLGFYVLLYLLYFMFYVVLLLVGTGVTWVWGGFIKILHFLFVDIQKLTSFIFNIPRVWIRWQESIVQQGLLLHPDVLERLLQDLRKLHQWLAHFNDNDDFNDDHNDDNNDDDDNGQTTAGSC